MSGRTTLVARGHGLAALFGFLALALLATMGVSHATVILYSDTFTAPDATALVGRTPEVSNAVAGATYGQHTAVFEKDIQSNQARIGADTGVSLPLGSTGSYAKPSRIRISATININTLNGSLTPINTGDQRGVGLGFYASTGGEATETDFRGLVLGTDGRLILAQDDVAGASRAGFVAEIATGISTASPHSVLYDIDTVSGDVSRIYLDGVKQPDVATTIFTSSTDRAGFFGSANSGGTTGRVDDFVVGLAYFARLRPITDLYNTGVDNSGTPRPDNVDDPHYDLISQPAPGGLTETTIPADGFPIPPWLANDADSRWIAPNTNDGNGPGGSYTYRTTFTLSVTADLDAVFISGGWASDDGGALDDILINGVSTGQSNGGFGGLTSFSISSGFVIGTNTLDFLVNNGGGPTGLRVDNLTGSYWDTTPEPGTLSLLALGGIGLLRRRRRRR